VNAGVTLPRPGSPFRHRAVLLPESRTSSKSEYIAKVYDFEKNPKEWYTKEINPASLISMPTGANHVKWLPLSLKTWLRNTTVNW
jgi:hypothetical protein